MFASALKCGFFKSAQYERLIHLLVLSVDPHINAPLSNSSECNHTDSFEASRPSLAKRLSANRNPGSARFVRQTTKQAKRESGDNRRIATSSTTGIQMLLSEQWVLVTGDALDDREVVVQPARLRPAVAKAALPERMNCRLRMMVFLLRY